MWSARGASGRAGNGRLLFARAIVGSKSTAAAAAIPATATTISPARNSPVVAMAAAESTASGASAALSIKPSRRSERQTPPTPVVLPDNLSEFPGDSVHPQISSEGNNVYVVWRDFTPVGIEDIFFAFSTDNGLTFRTPDNLSETPVESFDPQISSEGNNVYVVWTDGTFPNYDIFFAFSTDNGLTFRSLLTTSVRILEPPLSHKSLLKEITCMWYGQDTTPGNSDIFYKTNNQDFGLFGSALNLSHNSGESFSPQISSSP